MQVSSLAGHKDPKGKHIMLSTESTKAPFSDLQLVTNWPIPKVVWSLSLGRFLFFLWIFVLSSSFELLGWKYALAVVCCGWLDKLVRLHDIVHSSWQSLVKIL
jgi:hypothetical protein